MQFLFACNGNDYLGYSSLGIRASVLSNYACGIINTVILPKRVTHVKPACEVGIRCNGFVPLIRQGFQ